MNNLDHVTDTNLLRNYARLDGNTTSYDAEDEWRRMHRLAEMAEEINRRGLPFPEPIFSA